MLECPKACDGCACRAGRSVNCSKHPLGRTMCPQFSKLQSHKPCDPGNSCQVFSLSACLQTCLEMTQVIHYGTRLFTMRPPP